MEGADPRPSGVIGSGDSSHRLSALTGVAAAALLLVGFLVVGTDVPTYDDTPREFARFYAENDSSIELSVMLGIAGAGAFIWFAGFLRWQYGVAEQGMRGFQR